MAKMGLSPRRRACFPKRAFSTIFLKTQLSVVISLRPGHPERSKWASRLGGVRILSEEVFQRIYKVVGNPSCLGFFWLCLRGPGPLRKRPGSLEGGPKSAPEAIRRTQKEEQFCFSRPNLGANSCTQVWVFYVRNAFSSVRVVIRVSSWARKGVNPRAREAAKHERNLFKTVSGS